MKRLIILMVICTLLVTGIMAQTEGMLQVSVVTAPTGKEGRNYAPKHCVAIWIENESGKYVKTLLAYGQIRINNLKDWGSATMNSGFPYDRTDAITGATSTAHDTLQCAWDCSDFNGKQVPDGKYKLMMELTDLDGKGNTLTILFTKGKNKEILAPSDETSFKNIKAEWIPM